LSDPKGRLRRAGHPRAPGHLRTLDRFREVAETLGRRKLRTALVSLSVAWGIFMLVVLLAAGQGLSNGVQAEFGRDAENGVWLWGWTLSKPFRGNAIGRPVRLERRDQDALTAQVNGVTTSGGVYRPAISPLATRGTRQGAFRVQGVDAIQERLEKLFVSRGRFLNEADVAERRKVAVIGDPVQQALFAPHEDPLGAEVRVGAAVFRVVGILPPSREQAENQSIYVPITTAQSVWTGGERVGEIALLLGPAASPPAELATEVRTLLGGRHGFASDDTRALRVENNQESWARITAMFKGIRAFVWIIGLGTILAGIVGVSNIMLISVNERTREFGLRKAIGATPASIVRTVVEEALVITFVAGYVGLVAAVAVVQGVARVLPPTPFFSNPDVDVGVGLAATGVLMVAGVAAGLWPALRAARTNPITALRVE
jgi:putative ABC transport system permease protein